MTFGPAWIDLIPLIHQETNTPYLASTLGSSFPIHQPTMTLGLAKISSILLANLL